MITAEHHLWQLFRNRSPTWCGCFLKPALTHWKRRSTAGMLCTKLRAEKALSKRAACVCVCVIELAVWRVVWVGHGTHLISASIQTGYHLLEVQLCNIQWLLLSAIALLNLVKAGAFGLTETACLGCRSSKQDPRNTTTFTIKPFA